MPIKYHVVGEGGEERTGKETKMAPALRWIKSPCSVRTADFLLVTPVPAPTSLWQPLMPSRLSTDCPSCSATSFLSVDPPSPLLSPILLSGSPCSEHLLLLSHAVLPELPHELPSGTSAGLARGTNRRSVLPRYHAPLLFYLLTFRSLGREGGASGFHTTSLQLSVGPTEVRAFPDVCFMT